MSSFVCLCDNQKLQALGLGLAETVQLSANGVSINTKIAVIKDPLAPAGGSDQLQMKTVLRHVSEMFSRNIASLHSTVERLRKGVEQNSKLVPLSSIYREGSGNYVVFKTTITMKGSSIKTSGFIEVCDKLRTFEQTALKYA